MHLYTRCAFFRWLHFFLMSAPHDSVVGRSRGNTSFYPCASGRSDENGGLNMQSERVLQLATRVQAVQRKVINHHQKGWTWQRGTLHRTPTDARLSSTCKSQHLQKAAAALSAFDARCINVSQASFESPSTRSHWQPGNSLWMRALLALSRSQTVWMKYMCSTTHWYIWELWNDDGRFCHLRRSRDALGPNKKHQLFHFKMYFCSFRDSRQFTG
jgi:hypothetical protein